MNPKYQKTPKKTEKFTNKTKKISIPSNREVKPVKTKPNPKQTWKKQQKHRYRVINKLKLLRGITRGFDNES